MELASAKSKRVYKVVLTGGPCGGKTTGQSRLCTFFENLGWKVFRVPETASTLLSGGVKFADLSPEDGPSSGSSNADNNHFTGTRCWTSETNLGPSLSDRCQPRAPYQSGSAITFQENLLKTMIQMENTFFALAERFNRDCIIICDRGTMDASAFVSKEVWEQLMKTNGWNPVELRDTRYNQIIHMVSAAKGAEDFYTTEDHSCRSENLDLAHTLDDRAAEAWIGHPYFDVIDNSTNFDTKLRRMISAVCQRMGLDTGDRLETNAKKFKFLVRALPDDSMFPPFEDFDVIHDYLQTNSKKTQARLRKRGQKDRWSYTLTVRRPEVRGQVVEIKTQITSRDYTNMLEQRDPFHLTILKKRRCFLYHNQYFQLDIYKEPCHPRCHGLVLLETYTTQSLEEFQANKLPDFLDIVNNVTGDPTHSMYNLSLKEEWLNNKKFCFKLAADDEDDLTGSPRTNGWIGPHANGV
uniref:NadR/Ttd14 AAA domain-containing protein n=1 Tax=Daphnia galeata TaxID=27404 RepID=A0A8J2RDF4_9CRUS|nr:unnamed protein product [Daphnia galeata]